MSFLNHVRQFLPSLEWWKEAGRPGTLRADLIAGLTGAVIVLPQGVAYAYIAGMPPEYGLYTAMVVSIIAALFGSSWHMISGPAAAMSIVVISIASNHAGPDNYIETVITLTLMVGVIQLAIGLLKLGNVVNFISHTVVIGFTSGAAILIASSQVKHVLGVSFQSDGSLSSEWLAIIGHLSEANGHSILIALGTLVAALMSKKLLPTWPHLLVGMLAGAVLCQFLGGDSTGVAMVGAMPASLPPFSVPELSLTNVESLGSGALAIAMLGLIEAVSIARAIAIRSGQKIDGNQEVIGQGLGNLVGSFFSCFASSGSFTRSGANYDAGARTPLAAVIAAVLLAVLVLTVPQLTQFLPLPAMAGTVLLIAWNLLDIPHIRGISQAGQREIMVFVATLLVALEFAIYIGVLMSMLLFLLRTSQPGVIRVAPIQDHPQRIIRNVERYQLDECPQMPMLRFDGSIYFGSVDHFQTQLRQFGRGQQISTVLINACGVNFIDLSGAEMLRQEARRLKGEGIRLLVVSLKGLVIDELIETGQYQRIGAECFAVSTGEAITEAMSTMKPSICQGCTARIFRECQRFPGSETAVISSTGAVS